MTQITPPPNTEVQEEAIQEKVTQGEFHFIPGELEPIAPKKTLPEILKQALRPMFFGAIGIHALLLFTPLSGPQQTKPKETAEPVKLARLSDKVLVKSMPKVKVAAAPKKVNLPKIAVASTNPVIVNLPGSERAKTEENESEDKTIEQNKTENQTTKGDKGVNPLNVKPEKRTTDEENTSKLSKESKEFESVIAGLSELSNGTEEDKKAKKIDPYLLPEPKLIFPDPNDPDKVVSGIEGYSWISNNTVEQVVTDLTQKFSKGFKKTGDYAGGEIYEAKIGNSTRFITVFKVTSGSGVMVFQWAKSPV